jgi:WD40 repeat protein
MLGDGRMLMQLAFSPDGQSIAAADDDGAGPIALFSVANGSVLARFSGHQGKVTGLAFSPDGATLAATVDDGSLKCWEIANGSLRLDVHGKHESLDAVLFLDAEHVAAAGRDVDEGPPICVWKLP